MSLIETELQATQKRREILARISPTTRAMLDAEELESTIEIVRQLTGFKRSRLMKSALKYQRANERKAKRAFMDAQIVHLRQQIESGSEDRQEPLSYSQRD